MMKAAFQNPVFETFEDLQVMPDLQNGFKTHEYLKDCRFRQAKNSGREE